MLILPFISVILPFLLVSMVDGIKGIKETWQGILVSGVSFAMKLIVQHKISQSKLNYKEEHYIKKHWLSHYLNIRTLTIWRNKIYQ
ncbi:L-lactate permease [Bacillus thuringiensis serovar kurstaki str. HD-1]|nr:L-lactate permease [Bacillus thuringiensis serovar kurstaki str. HD-1]